MTSNSEYNKIFEGGISFFLNAINENCKTNFKTLEEAITAIQALKDAAQMHSDTKEVV
jgi:hypothetical protein